MDLNITNSDIAYIVFALVAVIVAFMLIKKVAGCLIKAVIFAILVAILGYLYYKGEGVSQNLDQAKDWLLWGWQHGHAPKVAVFNELGQYPGGMDLLLTASKEYYRPLGGFVFQW